MQRHDHRYTQAMYAADDPSAYAVVEVMYMDNIRMKITDGLLNLFADREVERVGQKLTDTCVPFLVPAGKCFYLMLSRQCFYLFIENGILPSRLLIEIMDNQNTHRSVGFYKDSISHFILIFAYHFLAMFQELVHAKVFQDYLKKVDFPQTPQHLYDPIRYILSLSGKRIRPLLVLMGASLFEESAVASALPASAAIEFFHNFS